MFWGSKQTPQWVTHSGVTNLLEDDGKLQLDERWRWWQEDQARLARTKFWLAPSLCLLQIIDLPVGIAFGDIRGLLESSCNNGVAVHLAWQPLGNKRLLVMSLPVDIWRKLPRWPQAQSWLVHRFNCFHQLFSAAAWHCLMVYPDGACVMSGEGDRLQAISLFANWQEALASVPSAGAQLWLDDPFGLSGAIPGWECCQ